MSQITHLRRTLLMAVAAVVLCLFVMTAESWGCPTCKDGISANGGNMVQGYGWSIVFMMSMPFTILFCMGTYFYLLVRRARREQAAAVVDPEFVTA